MQDQDDQDKQVVGAATGLALMTCAAYGLVQVTLDENRPQHAHVYVIRPSRAVPTIRVPYVYPVHEDFGLPSTS